MTYYAVECLKSPVHVNNLNEYRMEQLKAWGCRAARRSPNTSNIQWQNGLANTFTLQFTFVYLDF